ncbi:MAG: hypothetical protein U0414_02405 [Polyangiaceae bacterium]
MPPAPPAPPIEAADVEVADVEATDDDEDVVLPAEVEEADDVDVPEPPVDVESEFVKSAVQAAIAAIGKRCKARGNAIRADYLISRVR